MSAPELGTKDFRGAVVTAEWIPLPDGGQCRAFFGRCTVYEDKDALGFEVNSRDSKWLVRISGPTTSVVVPGCQVRHIFEGIANPKSSDFYAVP